MGNQNSTAEATREDSPLAPVGCTEYVSGFGINLSQAVLIDEVNDDHHVFKIPLNFNLIFNSKREIFEQIIYDRQRPIDTARAAGMADAITAKNGSHFWGALFVGYILGFKPRLLDGQHRLTAAQYMENSNYPAHLHILRFDSEEKMFEYFSIDLNTGVSVPLIYTSTSNIMGSICFEIVAELAKSFPKMIVNEPSSKPPRLTRHFLAEELHKVLINPRNRDPEFSFGDLSGIVRRYTQKIIEYNNQILAPKSLTDPEFIKLPKMLKMQKYRTIADKHRFYLGLVENFCHRFGQYVQRSTTNVLSESVVTPPPILVAPKMEEASQMSSTTPILPPGFTRRYKLILKDSQNPQIPHFNVTFLERLYTLAASDEADDGSVSPGVILEEYNTYLSTLLPNDPGWHTATLASTREKRYSNAVAKKCFFGLVADIDTHFKKWKSFIIRRY
jgi:hypothetical protein